MNLRAHLPSGVDVAQLTSLNAYFGARPIHVALDAGADIVRFDGCFVHRIHTDKVITGRCVDSALVTAPLMHAYKWAYDDWQALANTASVALP